MTLTPEELLSDYRATCKRMIELMSKGHVMPFLGSGVNLANRPADTSFLPGGQYLPDAAELSATIAREFEYPWSDKNLLRVCWYASAKKGKDELYDHLHNIFSRDYQSTDVHRFFAGLRKRFERSGYELPPQIIVTTNYDRTLENAFDEAGEPYDVFSYSVQRDAEVGKFRHTPYGATMFRIIDNPDEFYTTIDHTIILKIHGAVGLNRERSTFVITEDDYIDYAALFNPDHIPAMLLEKMLRRRFLYLGYSLSDWNLRVFLRGLRLRSHFNEPTWAIMNRHEEWDPFYWDTHGVRLIKLSLKDYIEILNEQLEEMLQKGQV